MPLPQRFNFDHLVIFREVVEQGSFASVALSRDVHPSSVSRTILALEDQFGERLFYRTTRTLSLTEKGEELLDRIDGILALKRAAMETVYAPSSSRSPAIRITGPDILLASLVAPIAADEGVDLEMTTGAAGGEADISIDFVPSKRADPPKLVFSEHFGFYFKEGRYSAHPRLKSGCVVEILAEGWSKMRALPDPFRALPRVSCDPVSALQFCLAGNAYVCMPDWMVLDLMRASEVRLFQRIQAAQMDKQRELGIWMPARSGGTGGRQRQIERLITKLQTRLRERT